MESYYTISTLHIIDGGGEYNEDDYVRVKTNNGDILTARIANIGQKEITLSFNDNYVDGEVTIKYQDIDSIEHRESEG